MLRILLCLPLILLAEALAAAGGAPDYVGSEACTTCHAEQYESWRGSHHDLAMQEATADTVLGDFDDSTFTHQSVTSRFFKQGDKFLVKTDNADGDLQDFEIKYTFGVDPLQQYLIEFPNGALQALGIAWDTRPESDGGQRWFHVYGDEKIASKDELHWTQRTQTWNYQCADCHSLNIRKNYDTETDTYATTWDVIDVGCEGCHGPAGEHVRLAPNFDNTVASNKGLTHSIIDHSGGLWVRGEGESIAQRSIARDSNAEINACARCHSRRAQLRERPFVGQPFLEDYRPALLTTPLYHADGQINEEVYVWGSFVQSKMHQAGVVCSDCHDPHSNKLLADGNDVCTTCHAPEVFDVTAHHHHLQDSNGAQCVECHMPAKNYMIIDSRRDHSMRIPRPDLSVHLGTPNACTNCHTENSNRWAADHIVEWRGDKAPKRPDHAALLAATRETSSIAQQAAAALVQDDSAAPIVRATAAQSLGRFPPREIVATLAAAGNDNNGLVRLGAIEALANAVPLLRMQIAIPNAYDDLLSVRVGAARMLAPIPQDQFPAKTRETVNGAMQEYVETQRLQSEHPNALTNLGAFYAERGEYNLGEQHYVRALNLSPNHLGATIGLAELFRQRGQDDKSEAILRTAVEQMPAQPELHHALGLAYVRLKRADDALIHLVKSAELAPAVARFHYVLAVARRSYGKPAKALASLEPTLDRFPENTQILVLLAELHRETGNFDKAVNYAERLVQLAPDDPGAVNFLNHMKSRAPQASP